MKLPPGRLAPTAALLITALVSAMDVTIVATVMPTIVGELGGLALYSWVIAGYLLTSTTTVPIYGRLADLRGRKPLFLVAMSVFLFGSVLCALAPRMELLIVARAVQGLGAGGLMTLVATLAGDLFPGEDRPKIQGLISTVWGLAAIVGPLAGSLIVSHASWRWVFWINLPVGLLAAGVLAVTVHERVERHRQTIDYAGAALLTLGVGALLLGLVEGGQRGFGAATVWAWFGASATLLAALAWVEARAPAPVVPYTLLRRRLLGLASVAAATLGACVISTSTYLPLLVQGAQGGTPQEVAWVTGAVSLAWTFGSIGVGRALGRCGYRGAALGGMALLSGGGVALALLGLATPLPLVVGAGAIVGLGMGVTWTTLIVMVQSAVDWAQRGAVTATLQFFQSIGGTLWVSVQGAVLSAAISAGLHAAGAGPESGADIVGRGPAALNAMLDPATRAAMPPDEAQLLADVLVGGLHQVFLLYLGAALLGLLVVALLPSPASQAASERRGVADQGARQP
ncbi:MAG TPA: MDR family MFS transporter [Chloroflexota bacterium]|nr:MDR family MFS transporter [Chloroflexota bacterium]